MWLFLLSPVCEQAVLNKRKDMRKEVYDMKVLEIIMPVLVMILLGIWCRKKNVLTQSGIDNIKSLVTNIMLPVAIFHARATGMTRFTEDNGAKAIPL